MARVPEPGARMLEDILDYLENIRDRPDLQPIRRRPRAFRGELPREPSDLAAVHEEFTRYILPYAAGHVHPDSWMGSRSGHAVVSWRKCWPLD